MVEYYIETNHEQASISHFTDHLLKIAIFLYYCRERYFQNLQSSFPQLFQFELGFKLILDQKPTYLKWDIVLLLQNEFVNGEFDVLYQKTFDHVEIQSSIWLMKSNSNVNASLNF